MDYEQFFVEASAIHKELKEKTDLEAKTVKKIRKCLDDGDVNALPKLFAVLREASREREDMLDRLEQFTASFDGRAYLSDGDFVSQMLTYCERLGVDAKGQYPVFEMFPCRVSVNADAREVVVDRKHLSCLRPSKLVSDIKAELERLSKVPFNAQIFGKELATAYDFWLLKKAGGKTYDARGSCYLLDLYGLLTPMRQHKKDYAKNNYAYDLARLYGAKSLKLEDGRGFHFDTTREHKKAIRILDPFGAELYISTIRLY